ncbi:NAD(P)-dependent oxidoreductase [Pseudohongiella sp. SYSU M77423]|uniref:NAD-dependent epimerase/dehydratase family protein n=1 Tax=Pseudohongiella sp. SYSU M77423 TaxID=3042312 RepID=UPI0024814428|nr:NAD(P)-dependent oxidoreductase [Pseudohongiella sp. SYSU M77423]MDH7944930.1 NAD(P)-dependent oxidoreductase [Pseudohongiella sp. SYSU M77423]
MINLYVSGASGAVGSRFIQYIIDCKSGVELILISSTITGYERLQEKFGLYKNVHIQKIEDLYCISSDAQNYFINFAFIADGVPWARIRKNFLLVKALADFSKAHDFEAFVEISSQSVFGFRLENTVDVNSNFGFWCEEYGLTKRAGERAAEKSLKNSSTRLSIIRLGNVLFRESGPFTQRIFNIYFSRHFLSLNQDGYVNGTFLENAIAGIWHVALNAGEARFNNIYHFSEISEVKWSDIYKLIDSQFGGYKRVLLEETGAEVTKRTLVANITTMLKSKYAAPIIRFFSVSVPDRINIRLHSIYRRKRPMNYNQTSHFDNSVLEAFSEKNQFKCHYPATFDFPINPANASQSLQAIYLSHIELQD